MQGEHFLAGVWSEGGPSFVLEVEWGWFLRLVLEVEWEEPRFCQAGVTQVGF